MDDNAEDGIAGSWPYPDWHAEVQRIRQERAAQWTARRQRRAADRAALHEARQHGLRARHHARELHIAATRDQDPTPRTPR